MLEALGYQSDHWGCTPSRRPLFVIWLVVTKVTGCTVVAQGARATTEYGGIA
jgi:hypothetical protein